MLPSKRLRVILLTVFTILITAFAILLFIYIRNVGKLKAGCVVELESSSAAISLSIEDSSKWNDFIKTIGKCSNNKFNVYEVYGENKPIEVSRIEYKTSLERQANSVSGPNKEIFYTYGYSFSDNNKKAEVILNFPNSEKIDSQLIGGAIILSSYRLFNGKPMTETVESINPFFGGLTRLGLTYEMP